MTSASTSLNGQRVLVVGGARDLGLAVAKAAGTAGATPVIGARQGSSAAAAASTIDGADWVVIDVTDEASVVAAFERAGSVDHVVVVASAHHNAPVTELDHDSLLAAFEAKVIGPMLLAKHAARVLPATGSIVLLAGLAAWTPTSSSAALAVTNGAVAFAATHLAKELAPIRANTISPGIVDSGSWDGWASRRAPSSNARRRAPWSAGTESTVISPTLCSGC